MKEIEKNFFNYDKKKIIQKIKKLGGKHTGTHLFKVFGFNTQHIKNIKRLRIRHEDIKKTLTVKMDGGKYDDEYEINIDDITAACDMLKILGFPLKDYYEKIREAYNLNGSEFAFDILPGVGEYLQIESPSEKELTKLTKLFELNNNDNPQQVEKQMIDDFDFNFKLYDSIEIRSFENINKMVDKLVKKNRTKYKKIIKSQMDLYKTIKY